MVPGDVYWADLGYPPGHAQQGHRPVVVLQDDGYMSAVPTVVVVPFTATLGATRFPGTVLARAAPQNGLARDSVALLFQLRVLDRSDFGRHAGNVGPAVLAQLHAELDRVLGRVRPSPGGTP